jgi:hypothetical protein
MQTNPMIVDEQVDALYRVIKGHIDWTNLIPTCIEVAREVEGMTQLRGKERLDLLIKTLKHALRESDVSDEERASCLVFIDTVVPVAMQAAILASKSPIVHHVASSCWRCFCAKK